MGSRRIDAVARAISEGHPVDWDSLERATPAGDRTRLQHLRTLEALAADRRGEPAATPDALAYPWLWRIICAIAVAQSLLALGRFAGSLVAGLPSFPVLLQGSSIAALLVCAGALVRFGGDARALNLAALLLLLSASGSQPFLAWYRTTPLAPFAAGFYPDAFLPFFAWSFVRDFPRILRFSRLDTVCAAAIIVSLGVGASLFAANVALRYLAAENAVALLEPLRRRSTTYYWVIVFGLMLPALVMMAGRIRHAPATERRRVGFFLGGLLVGLVPVVMIVSLEMASHTLNRLLDAQPSLLALLDAVIYASILTIPFTTTYAVLVQRVLPAKVAIRNTLRYALARQTLFAAIVLPLAALGGWIVRHRELTIGELFTGVQAVVALGLAATALVLLLIRAPVLRYLERRYFRGEVDLSGELTRLTDALGEARDARHVAEIVEAAVERSLQVDRVDLYRTADGGFLPVRGRGTPLDRSSALSPILEVSADATDLETSGLKRLLPKGDQAWMEGTGTAAIAPMMREDALAGFIAVGHRRNDLEFSVEALAFLTAVASSAMLALGRPQRHGARADAAPLDSNAEPPAAECEACGKVVEPTEVRCLCGGRLRAAALPLVLAGKFRIESRLGSGGMGVVYRASDTSLGRPVALKTLPRLTGAAIDRLQGEAQSMARAGHGSLATIHAIETWDRSPVLVIELLEGGTLAERIGRGALPARDAVITAMQLAGALAHLHRYGLVHRDIKPGNIGFTAGGQLKLLDFGLAAVLQEPASAADSAHDPDSSGPRIVSGTPLYLPPEAWEDVAPGPHFDLWAAGVVLYEMLAGQHPLAPARSLREAVAQLRGGRLVDPRRFPPDVPAPVGAFVERALARHADERHPTAVAFVRELAATLPDEPAVQAHVVLLRTGGFDV